MNYDDNLKLAQEVLDFVMSGQILRITPVTISSEEFEIETDFVRARERCLEQGNLPGEEEQEMYWEDIRDKEIGRAIAAHHQLTDEQRLILRNREREMTNGLEKFLFGALPDEYKEYYHDATNDIHLDLCWCIKSRLTIGIQNQLFETVFRVYQQGGCPCSWRGNYPEGKMIVFVPRS